MCWAVLKSTTRVPITDLDPPQFTILNRIMKKYFAFAACAVLLAGCDFLGGADAPVASVANITITDATLGGSSDIRVEVQDVAGRAYSESNHANVALPLSLDMQFDVHNGARGLAIVIMRDNGASSTQRYSFLASSELFNGDGLAAAAGSSVQVNGSVSATIDVAGSAE